MKRNLPSTRGRTFKVRNPEEKYRDAEKKTRKLAIYAKCYDCVGGDADPAYQWRIGNCIIPGCALYRFRPFQDRCGKPKPKSLG